MYSCNEVGKQQADEVLMRVPLRLYDKSNAVTGTEAEAEELRMMETDTEAVVGVLKELNETCSEHKREATRRTICRVSQIACQFLSR